MFWCKDFLQATPTIVQTLSNPMWKLFRYYTESPN